MSFDEAASRRLLRAYLTPDVVRQREVVLAALSPAPGEHVLDVGSGPGLMAVQLAAAVGPEGRVDGVDPSDSMLAIARERQPAPGSAPLAFTSGDALAIPFGDGAFDALVSTQVYEYVGDIAGALAEARRVLRPGGRIAILDTDWDSLVWHSSDAERTRRILTAWDEHLADPHLPRLLPGLLARAGFGGVHTAVVPMLNVGYDRDTFSAGLLELVADFVAGRGAVSDADAAAWVEDLRALGDGYFFSVNRYLFTAVR